MPKAYRDMTPEEKRRHNALTTAWNKAHPEVVGPINKRACDKFRDNKKREHWGSRPKYKIVGLCGYPIGTIVTGVGWDGPGRCIITTDGIHVTIGSLVKLD